MFIIFCQWLRNRLTEIIDMLYSPSQHVLSRNCMHWHHRIFRHIHYSSHCLHSINCNSYYAVSSFRGHRDLFCPTIHMHCTATVSFVTSITRRILLGIFYHRTNGAPLTHSAAFDVLDELQLTRFGWNRIVLCSRLSCSGLKSTGLLGGCRPSRHNFLLSVFALFNYFLSSVGITLVQLSWLQLSV